jgi:hypothetical protein
VAELQGNEERKSKAEGEEGQVEGFTLQPNYQAPFSTIYSNFALISHTGDDLSIDFCLVAPPFHPQMETKTVPVPVIARVIVPPGLAQGLIEALQIQLDKQRSEREARHIILPMQKTGPDFNG